MTLATGLAIVYGLFCVAGIGLDTYSLVCHIVGHRRPAPPGIPLAGLILYVLAGMWRSFTGASFLLVHWELLGLAAYHLLAHVVLPLADRLWLRATKGHWGRPAGLRVKR